MRADACLCDDYHAGMPVVSRSQTLTLSGTESGQLPIYDLFATPPEFRGVLSGCWAAMKTLRHGYCMVLDRAHATRTRACL